jgi:hypothetical protein
VKTTPKRPISWRVLVTVLVCGALLVGVTASPADATTSTAPTTNVRGLYGDAKDDGRCPAHDGALFGRQQHRELVALAKTRFGPGLLKLDLCETSNGAMGGRGLGGTFSLTTFVGTLRGTVSGTLAFGAALRIRATLTVERGSFLLARLRGTLDFQTALPLESRVFDGTLTTSLHRV